jgi:hypothetical protein
VVKRVKVLIHPPPKGGSFLRKDRKKCKNPFIPYSTNRFEVYCFPCQYATGMFDEMWSTVSQNTELPYGTSEMRKTFKKYIGDIYAVHSGVKLYLDMGVLQLDDLRRMLVLMRI